ncbi:hypothetical protein ABW19_dt0204018 [Dactylella cylindrospora]|nr:hypothetical protein ABW19_dt0204018 [Dactylella cylindrospora]
MYSKICTSTLIALMALVPYISAHGVIVNAVGDASSVQGAALGMDPNTPRDGTRRRPFQQDTTIFEEDADELATASGCGQTLAGGANNVQSGVSAMAAQGTIPQVTAGGQLTMTLHQVNADGAGPYACMIDMTGTGASFQPLQVTTQVPGERGRDRDGNTTPHPLVVAMPANMQCTGTAGGATGICMVRCQNPARNGPFGGCVPVQQMPVDNANAVANPNLNTGAGNVNNGNVNNGNVNAGANTGVNTGANTNNGQTTTGQTGNANTGVNTGANVNGQTGQATSFNRNQRRAAKLLTDADFLEEDAEDAEEEAKAAATAKPAKPARKFRFHRH